MYQSLPRKVYLKPNTNMLPGNIVSTARNAFQLSPVPDLRELKFKLQPSSAKCRQFFAKYMYCFIYQCVTIWSRYPKWLLTKGYWRYLSGKILKRCLVCQIQKLWAFWREKKRRDTHFNMVKWSLIYTANYTLLYFTTKL